MGTKTSRLPRGGPALSIIVWGAFIAAGSCKSTSPPLTDGGGQGGSGGGGGAGGTLSCGGVTNVSGTTPKGALSTNLVRVVLAGANCDSPGAPTVLIENSQTGDEVTFTIALQADAGTSAVLGPQTVNALISVSGTTTSVSGSVDVGAADDPRAVALANADGGAPTGAISGTLSISDAGVALSGSFQSPYCAIARCFGH